MEMNLDELIDELENLTTCDNTNYSYISDNNVNTVLYYLKKYREECKELIDAIKHFKREKALEPEIKKCGCGGNAVVRDYSHFGSPFILVECEQCGMQTDLYSTKNEAIEAWNTAINSKQSTSVERVDMPNPKNEVYRCLNCGQYMHRTSWSSNVNYCSRCGAEIEW